MSPSLKLALFVKGLLTQVDTKLSNSLACCVGLCWPIRSSFSMCNNVVFPALSSPRNTSLPDFFHSPESKKIATDNVGTIAGGIMKNTAGITVVVMLNITK